ncbi:MAG: right-handed parallel beta-helix repeat-containing protein [Pseudomonadota bacterium]|nr:right-handed parallel beta-helix repeat-containing protein [Pseudomonadota bacterium]
MQRKTHTSSQYTILTRLFTGAGLIASLAACGSGNQDAAAPAGTATAATVTSAAQISKLPAGSTNTPVASDTATATTTAAATGTWTDCARESQTCNFSGTQVVRYGASGQFFYKTFTSSVLCANEVFGDPAVGIGKTCSVGGTAPTAPPTTPTPTPTPTPTTGAVQPVPTNIANGSTVNLTCGVTYQGTLDLTGKSNVTVKTAGTCGKASITPGRAVTGFVKGTGNIYSAPISFTPLQVTVGGAFVSAAHWPNTPWATSTSGMPSTDLTGATLVYLDNQSVIKSQALTSNSVSTGKPFYVEGKLWMLDQPGEWAVQNGRLYIWSADGQSPEGKVWAAANGNGINANNSSGVTIDSVSIFAASDGISAETSTNLKVLNTDITNSSRDGIWASGSNGLQVNASTIANSRRNGIDGWYSVNGAVITNSTVSNTGMVGMPSETGAGIMFGDGGTNRIDNVRVTNSGYHGISVLHNRNTNVTNSVVDVACVRLTDCGGIYTGARDQLPLTLLIEGNTVSNVKGTEGVAIYLDDFSNGVTVNKNTVTGNTRGLLMHNAFNNVISNNTVSSSAITHMTLVQDTGNMRNNKVTYNKFNSTGGEQNYNMETGSNLKTFISADYNTYTSTDVNTFSRYWNGSSAGVTQSYTSWKAWSGLDVHSAMNGR